MVDKISDSEGGGTSLRQFSRYCHGCMEVVDVFEIREYSKSLETNLSHIASFESRHSTTSLASASLVMWGSKAGSIRAT